jgi:DNA polymerase-1
LRELDRASGNNSSNSGSNSADKNLIKAQSKTDSASTSSSTATADQLGFVAEHPREVMARNYTCVTTQSVLHEWVKKIQDASLTCIDTETTGLDALRVSLVGISLAVTPGEACYIPLAHTTNEDQLDKQWVLEQLRPWLEGEQYKKLGQNLKYDIHIFANEGITLKGVEHDTLLQSYVLESHRSHDMDGLAQRHLGEKTTTYEEVCGKGVHQISFDQRDRLLHVKQLVGSAVIRQDFFLHCDHEDAQLTGYRADFIQVRLVDLVCQKDDVKGRWQKVIHQYR